MDSKLTLKLDKAIIEKAKAYASSQNKSLSRMIESYLKFLVESTASDADHMEISPYVKSMKTGVNIPADFDEKREYEKHLSEKHS